MEYSIPEPEPERRPVGLSYALGSLYDRFQGLSDPRKAKGKRYSLLTLLVVIFLAKLSGHASRKPGEIADWAKNHADTLVELLQLRQSRMPHACTTVRCVSPAAGGYDGEILALDGKALKGTRRVDQERCDTKRVVSVYDGQTQRVLVQEVVETKENETPAPPSGACCGSPASLRTLVAIS